MVLIINQNTVDCVEHHWICGAAAKPEIRGNIAWQKIEIIKCIGNFLPDIHKNYITIFLAHVTTKIGVLIAGN